MRDCGSAVILRSEFCDRHVLWAAQGLVLDWEDQPLEERTLPLPVLEQTADELPLEELLALGIHVAAHLNGDPR